ncbi:vWA domain-containing protein [Deinococcus yavapaiensis]|uniref:Uncharacterized protein YegL n=1 Tax=Deinococcus yavapaiensis KR-236 TaxID=694435 RepID=A0A318S4W3_9DEIO|nr:VWA domain-containing protein [Deinococcus yavapaiensis]PYE52733.1 uncharacterized protein YegL [Deinococcus yavapaiensis KR-236]
MASNAPHFDFTEVEFADNPEPRCPVVLLLDNSGSMRGEPMRELNLGLRAFRDDLLADPLAAKRCELAVISFGPVRTVSDFVSAADFESLTLLPEGDTPMGSAIERGLDMLRVRKDMYRRNGIAYYRPWVFLVTDGAPTDKWQDAARAVHDGEQARAFAFFAVGVEKADMKVLKQISVREPVKLRGLQFRQMFQWLSSSLRGVSRSTPGTIVPLSPPTGWTDV